jgi:hypothetical protein
MNLIKQARFSIAMPDGTFYVQSEKTGYFFIPLTLPLKTLFT